MRLNQASGWQGAIALAAVAILPAAAHAQARPPIVARAEACLRQNVDHVVASEHDLQSAAAFLVTYACAAEVSGAARYERNSAYVTMFQAMFKTVGQVTPPAQAAAGAPAKPATPPPEFKASVDPETGEIVTPPTAPGAPANPIASLVPMMSSIFGQVAPEAVPVGIRKLAGDIVLAAHDRAAAKAR